ncbi:SDR family NAD(P)-dependent oxidoreductase, partial [Nonomuraea sp. RK-328]|nr:SDR family NAD(P)-dependent oxidoreductase [Nonomuraea sp. RK-328]
MTVTYDYADKVVLVTGGTKGIGAGIARAFQEAGATVVTCARTPPPGGPRDVSAQGGGGGVRGAGSSFVAGGAGGVRVSGSASAQGDGGAEGIRPVRFVQADVRDPEDVARLISGLDRLDVVVNNAGGSPHAPLDGTSPRLHARVIELNLTAPLLVSQRAYPLLKASGGAVIMIGSASGTRPSPGTSAYGAAKAGLHH